MLEATYVVKQPSCLKTFREQKKAFMAQTFACLVLMLLVQLSAMAQKISGPADIVLRGGKVITVDAKDQIAEAIAIKGNLVLAVGSNAEIKRYIGPKTQVVELHGRSVTPGFIDAHTHTEHTAEFLRLWVDIHVPPLTTTAQIIDKVREKVKTLKPGEWVVAQGTFGQIMPTPEELTRNFPDNPVVLRWSRHAYNVNQMALDVSGITAATPDPQGGKITKGPDGKPTGYMQESFDLLKVPQYPPNELKDALEYALREYYLKQGITSVYDMPGNQAIPQYWALHDEGKLPVRLRVTYTVWPGSQWQMTFEDLMKSGLRPGMGDEWLKVGGVKMFVDGVDDNYKTPLPVLKDHVRKAFEAGWQVQMHAIAPKAQDMALEAIEDGLKEFPNPDARPRIEHLGGSLDTVRLERAKRLGVVPVPQPNGLSGGGRQGAVARLPFKSMIAMGFQVPGSSDTAGTRTDTLNPMLNIYWLVTRQGSRGGPQDPAEALTVLQAVRMYTAFGAHAGFEEKIKGSLEPGKLADLVVQSADILSMPKEELKDVKADITIIDGKVRYDRNAPGTTGVPGDGTGSH